MEASIISEEERMELSKKEIEQFNSEGFLFVPSLFDAEEIANLN